MAHRFTLGVQGRSQTCFTISLFFCFLFSHSPFEAQEHAVGVSPKSLGGVNVREGRGREGREEGGEPNLREGDMQKKGGEGKGKDM